MSALVYSRLLDDFRSGWHAAGEGPLVLEYAAPRHPIDPSFGRLACTYEYLGSACLPDAKGEWLLACAIVKHEPQIAQAIDEFKRLCGEASAYLPTAIRDWIDKYYWTDTAPASWWTALLARFYQIPGDKINESYLTRPKLIEPWVMSCDVIEKLRLNTDSPGWLDADAAEGGAIHRTSA